MSVSLTQRLPEAQDTQQTLPVDYETQSNGFAIIPNSILRARNLSRDAKLLYSILRSYAWQKDTCFPSYETLMADMQCSSQALSTYIKELIEHGLIAVQRRGQGKTSLYIITDTVTSAKVGRRQEQETAAEQSSSLIFKEQELRKSKTEEYSSKENEDRYLSSTRIGESDRDYVNLPGTPVTAEALPQPAADGGESIQHSKSFTTHHSTKPPKTTTPSSIETSKNRKKRNFAAPAREIAHDMPFDSNRGVILEFLSDFAFEFRDQAPLTSSTTRAYNLYRQSGKSMDDFTNCLYSARATTKERAACIRKYTADGFKSSMAYFFAVLEDRLGLRQRGRACTT